MSVRRNLALNGSATLIHKVVLAGKSIILIPFYLTAWGAAVYGEWLILSAMTTILSFCNLGLGTAAGNAFVLRYANSNIEGAKRAMKTGQCLLGFAVLIGIVIGSISILIITKSGLLSQLEVPQTTAISVLVLLGISSLIRFNAYFQDAWFRAARKAHLSIYIDVFLQVLKLLLFIVILFFRMNMVWLAIVELTTSLLLFSVYYYTGRKLLPEAKPQSIKIDKEDLKIFIYKGLAFMAEPIRQLFSQQSLIVIARVALGPESVALLGTLRTLTNSVIQLFIALQGSIFPEMQFAIASNKLHVARKLYSISIIITFLLSIFGIISILFFGSWIYSKWTTGALLPPSSAWPLLSSALMANALWLPGAYLIRAYNLPGRLAAIGITAAITGTFIGWLLVGLLDINGLLIGILIMEVIMATYILPNSMSLINYSIRNLINDTIKIRPWTYFFIIKKQTNHK